MDFVADVVIEEWFTQVGAPDGVCISLRDGLAKIIEDGKKALQNGIQNDDLKQLEKCRCCVISETYSNIFCIDMDAMMEFLYKEKERPKSVDLVFPREMDAGGKVGVLCAEGKLGTLYSSDRLPRNPSKEVLYKKFTCTKDELERRGVIVLKRLYLIVGKWVFQQQKHRVKRWNLGSRTCDIQVVRLREFLNLLSVSNSESRDCDSCEE